MQPVNARSENLPGFFWQIDDTNSRCQVAARPYPPARGTVGSPRTCCRPRVPTTGHAVSTPSSHPKAWLTPKPWDGGAMSVDGGLDKNNSEAPLQVPIHQHQEQAQLWILRMSSVAPQNRWTVGLLACVLHALELTRPVLPCPSPAVELGSKTDAVCVPQIKSGLAHGGWER